VNRQISETSETLERKDPIMRSYSATSFAALVCLGLLAGAGCAVDGGRLSLVATQPPANLPPPAATVEGTSSSVFVLGAGKYRAEGDVEAAVRDALSKAPGTNLLVNVQMEHYRKGLYDFIEVRGIRVRGEAVKYVPAAGSTAAATAPAVP
jgi:hypothetical protein